MKEDKASSTAYTVLQGILFSASKPEYQKLVSEETQKAGRQILSASAEGRKRLSQLNQGLFRFFAPYMEQAMMPGITLHYVLRKRYIRDAAEKAIADGYTQIVNLGAGFDTLAWELHNLHPDINFIELDHPATSAQKNKALSDQADNFHLLPVDFSQMDARQALESAPCFDATRRTFFICEGVLMYLSRPDIDRLFQGLKALCGAGTRMVFTSVVPMESKDSNSGWLLRWYLKFKSEPLNWMIEQKEQAGFVQSQGYQLVDLAGTDQLKSRYLQGIRHGVLHQGEYMVSVTIPE
ncbi:class I SAM-dependent methyltransferase [Oceanospirillum sediminis]|uniref:S-adenosyl-L-methionine-dependent methyltransferase n=1 Tax=Oceanospirillum sediminis TaxID=2760088 RepID=A0A839IUM5_9GAMM|nr:SAM-dependent methyltransferase [Oceanospirillum sediminis]MBB1489055.1 class I SAM-dependent methyltransferase [Oceanospirillum sediminis]